MISRRLLVGFAVLIGFALDGFEPAAHVAPASAREGRPGARIADGTESDRIAIIGDDGADPAEPVRRRRPSRIKTASVLPPSRPVVEAAASAVPQIDPTPIVPLGAPPSAPVASQAEGVLVADPVLPPIRPSLPEPASSTTTDAAADATAPPSRVDAGRAVALLPPARPDFEEVIAAGNESGFVPVEPETSGRISVVRLLPPERPAFPWDEPTETASLPDPAPSPQPRSLFGSVLAALPSLPSLLPLSRPGSGHNGLDGMITAHAKLNDVPEDLVHRVVIRESKYNPRAIGHGGAMGLMQIKAGTARALGYSGTPAGLLDADTNLTYAVKYLAGAYRVAGGDYDRAVSYYARGYYYAAKQSRGTAFAAYRGGRRNHHSVQEADASAVYNGEPAVVAKAAGETTSAAK